MNDNNYDKRNLPKTLENFKSIAVAISETLGDYGEVVLHDLRFPESSLYFIAGNVTNREVGAPATNLVLSQFSKNEPQDLVNYQVTLDNGKKIRSSIIFIRNEKDEVLGCLGINYDHTKIDKAIEILNKLQIKNNEDQRMNEKFPKDINEMFEVIIKDGKEKIGKPIRYMSKKEKIELVRYLKRKGLFNIKNSVEKLASRLGVSKYTIYNYLKEVDK